jgi:hypothetical protein
MSGKMLFAICALAMVATAPLAQAAPIYIDFSDNIDESVAPDSSGRYWNQLAGTATGMLLENMIDGANGATAVDLNLTAGSFNGEITFSGNGGPITPTLVDWDNAVVNDLWYTADSATLSIEGLDPTKSYDLAFYGANRADSYRGLKVTIGGVEQIMAFNTAEAPMEALLNFNGLAPDASGKITAVVADGSGLSYAYLSGLQITAVPEPTTLGLVVLGGIGALIRRRR